MSEQLVKEELYLQIMDGLEKSCRLMAAYDEMPHEYGDSILYQVESHTIERIGITPGITSSELSAGMNKTPSASSQIIRKLRKKGLVFQKRNKDNNREYNLFLTDYGWRIYKAHAAVDEECGGVYGDCRIPEYRFLCNGSHGLQREKGGCCKYGSRNPFIPSLCSGIQCLE